MDDTFLFYYGLVAFLNAAAGIFFAYLEYGKKFKPKSQPQKTPQTTLNKPPM